MSQLPRIGLTGKPRLGPSQKPLMGLTGSPCCCPDSPVPTKYCEYCNPNQIPVTAYIIIESVAPGLVPATACKAANLPLIPGTWAADGEACTWGPESYPLASCLTCPAQGFSYIHFLNVRAFLTNFTTDIKLSAEISAGAPSVSTDCTTAYSGGTARYGMFFGSTNPNCIGEHTLTRESGILGGSDGYIAWPSTIKVLLPAA